MHQHAPDRGERGAEREGACEEEVCTYTHLIDRASLPSAGD